MNPNVFVCCIFASLWLLSEAEDEKQNDFKEFVQNTKRDRIMEKIRRDKKIELGKFDEPTLRPTKCHICRVLAQELVFELNKTKEIKKSYYLSNQLDEKPKQKKIDYKHSEIRIMDILEVVCNNVFNYRAVSGPEFPYLRGVKSSVRQSLEQAMVESGLSIKLDAPEEVVADPSSELRRMFYMCNQMVEEYEDDIMDWYIHKQDEDPIEFVCAERIVDSDKQDCLHASTEIPEGDRSPVMFNEDEKKSTFHFESSHKAEL